MAAYPEELDEWVRRQSPNRLEGTAAPTVSDAADLPELGRRREAGHRTRLIFAVALCALFASTGYFLLGTREPVHPNVTLGLRVNGRQSMLNIAPGVATSLSFRDGESIWLTPEAEGDDLRVRLAEGRSQLAGSTPREVGSVVLRRSHHGAADAVSFAHGEWTLDMWWPLPEGQR